MKHANRPHLSWLIVLSAVAGSACVVRSEGTTPRSVPGDETRPDAAAHDAAADLKPPVVVTDTAFSSPRPDAPPLPSAPDVGAIAEVGSSRDGRPPADLGAPPPPDVGEPPPPRTGLVAHWKFDDGSGSPFAQDVSGNRNRGVLVNFDHGACWTNGPKGGALRLGLRDSWVVVPASESLDAISETMSVAAWVRRQGTAGGPSAIVSRQFGKATEEQFYFGTDQDRAVFFGRGIPLVKSDAPNAVLPLGEWVHVAATYDGNESVMYLNGRRVGTGRKPGRVGPAGENDVIIGGNVNDGGKPGEIVRADVDDLRLYDRALSEFEVFKLLQ
jgi:hypothetical protein